MPLLSKSVEKRVQTHHSNVELMTAKRGGGTYMYITKESGILFGSVINAQNTEKARPSRTFHVFAFFTFTCTLHCFRNNLCWRQVSCQNLFLLLNSVVIVFIFTNLVAWYQCNFLLFANLIPFLLILSPWTFMFLLFSRSDIYWTVFVTTCTEEGKPLVKTSFSY